MIPVEAIPRRVEIRENQRMSTHLRAAATCIGGLILVLVPSSCGLFKSAPVPDPVPVNEPILLADRLYADQQAEIDSTMIVITDQRTLTNWWDRATEFADPKPELREIDFGTHVVAFVAAGRSRSGAQIRVDSLRSEVVRGREIWSLVVRFIPDCDRFPGTAFPIEFVRVRRVSADIGFVYHRQECP